MTNKHQEWLSEWGQDLKYAKGRNKKILEKWGDTKYKVSDFNKDINLISVPDKLIVIEYDGLEYEESKKRILEGIKKLENDKISYDLYCHGGRSPYVHFYITKKISPEQKYELATKYFESDNLDKSNLNSNLIPIPYAAHWKYGTPHQLLKSFEGDIVDVSKIKFETKPKSKKKFYGIQKGIDILDVFNDYGIEVNSKNMGICPFHEDNNPSLKTYPETNSFYCFGCNKGGDAIKFISLMEGKPYKEIKKEVGILPTTATTFTTKEIINKSKKIFNEPELILEIHKELDKGHLMDDAVKLSTFLTCCTAYLEPSELHKSQALKGGTSVGKDNNIKNVLKHFPNEDWIFLTGATKAVMEDDIFDYKIIAYSEMNIGREDGANINLREVVKQLTEGGTETLKKDVNTGYKSTKHTIQEQKSVLYGTTETEDDDELATRFVIGGIEGHPKKTKAVNINTFNWFAGEIKKGLEPSWIKEGIRDFKQNKVVLPFAKDLDKIENLFDDSDPRSMRDVKRILSYTCAVSWLYQKQREIDKEGYIIGEPVDFIIALVICKDFFNYTYKGLGDRRFQQFIDIVDDYIKNKPEPYFYRHIIQERMGCSLNTVKKVSKGVNQLGLIRYIGREGNNLKYERCQKGVKKVLIGVKVKDIISHFKVSKGVKNKKHTVYYDKIIPEIQKIIKKDKKDSMFLKIDTLNLTPLTKDNIEEIKIKSEDKAFLDDIRDKNTIIKEVKSK